MTGTTRIGTVIDHAQSLAIWREAGRGELPAFPAGTNTVRAHFVTADGLPALLVNQRGHAPQASDNEQEVNGCSVLIALDSPDRATARATLEAAVLDLLGIGPPAVLDAQLTVKLTRAELVRLKTLPRLTGDRGLSALARRLLLEELARQTMPGASGGGQRRGVILRPPGRSMWQWPATRNFPTR